MIVQKKRRHAIIGYLFFLPFAVFFVIFRLIPFYNAIKLAFYKWDILGTPKFVGLKNFEKMFSDPTFLSSLWHTFYFTILVVPPIIIFSFLIAVLINGKVHFKNLLRSAFYLPFTLSISVVCLTWGMIYSPFFGIFAQVFKFFGLKPINWLGDATWAMPAIAITTIWWTIGFGIILYIAGLQQIPSSYYEAADLDGANGTQKMFFITIPLLKRTHLLVIVMQILASLQIFGQVFIMTSGGPAGKTRVLLMYVYEQGFRYFKMGYAQAMVLILFLIMLVFAYFQIRLMMGRKEVI